MTKLGVNIDHVATLREVRHAKEPDLVSAALLCEKAGADSIVAHLREDRRHIQERDLFLLKKAIKTKLNLEMSISPDIVKIACKLTPAQATLVPERRQELTTEGGLDVVANFKKIKQVCEKLKERAISVSLFIDPDKKQIEAAEKLGVKRIELHTGRYANAQNDSELKIYFKELKTAASYAANKGLDVSAGHGLDYKNTRAIVRIKTIEELNIGYAIVCRSVIVGLEQAVRQMKKLIENYH
jgi:pyridoxine 5-phosphate synthase